MGGILGKEEESPPPLECKSDEIKIDGICLSRGDWCRDQAKTKKGFCNSKSNEHIYNNICKEECICSPICTNYSKVRKPKNEISQYTTLDGKCVNWVSGHGYCGPVDTHGDNVDKTNPNATDCTRCINRSY